jgi:hypothetical protein
MDPLNGGQKGSSVEQLPASGALRSTVPFKLNQDRRHHIPRQQHKVTMKPVCAGVAV